MPASSYVHSHPALLEFQFALAIWMCGRRVDGVAFRVDEGFIITNPSGIGVLFALLTIAALATAIENPALLIYRVVIVRARIALGRFNERQQRADDSIWSYHDGLSLAALPISILWQSFHIHGILKDLHKTMPS